MFGYVTTDRSEMLGKDFDTYKAIYCSLCKQLGKEYTFFSRFILSYDCTFYAVLALSLSDTCPGFCQGRCRFNPLKKCNYLKQGENELSKVAALSVISVYYKLIDNIADGGFFEKLGCYLLLPFFSHCRKKASRKFPQLDQAVSLMSQHQFEYEQDKNCSIDKAAEPTAQMLSTVMSLLSDDDNTSRICGTFGYFLGKWIYLCDAANDFDDDVKHSTFNPYIIAYGEQKSEHVKDIEASLNHCLSELLLSYNLMQPKRFSSIIENVLIYGLPKKQSSVLYKDKE